MKQHETANFGGVHHPKQNVIHFGLDQILFGLSGPLDLSPWQLRHGRLEPDPDGQTGWSQSC